MYDRPVTSSRTRVDPRTDPRADPRTWRPQRFGLARARDVRDPIVEPLWRGARVLVHVTGTAAELCDEDGERLEFAGPLPEAIAAAALADGLVLDGYLTVQPARSTEGVVVGRLEAPGAGEIMGQMLFGSRAAERLAHAVPVRAEAGEAIALVAVDILALEGEPLLDVPLLERKRLLESALAESDLVRLGAFVRPPVEPWLASWRAMGFVELAFKAANGRYTPGERNAGWARAPIPRR